MGPSHPETEDIDDAESMNDDGECWDSEPAAAQGGIPESGFCEISEFVNPEMKETLSFRF